jgi:hypothetical protein
MSPFILGFFPRVRIPAVALEPIAGITVGPAVLGWIEPGPVVSVMASIGVAFLLFLAGLELDLSLLKGAALVRGSLSFLLSFALALAMMAPLGAEGLILSPLLVASALSATSPSSPRRSAASAHPRRGGSTRSARSPYPSGQCDRRVELRLPAGHIAAITASPNWLHFTSCAPCIWRAKS